MVGGVYSFCEEHVINTFSIFKGTVVREFTQLQFYSRMVSSTIPSEPNTNLNVLSQITPSLTPWTKSLFCLLLLIIISVRKKDYFDISFFLFDQLLSEVSVQGLPSDITGYYEAHVSTLHGTVSYTVYIKHKVNAQQALIGGMT